MALAMFSLRRGDPEGPWSLPPIWQSFEISWPLQRAVLKWLSSLCFQLIHELQGAKPSFGLHFVGAIFNMTLLGDFRKKQFSAEKIT